MQGLQFADQFTGFSGAQIGLNCVLDGAQPKFF